MGSRLKFRPRMGSGEPKRDRGTKESRLCGWPFNRVGRKAETGVRGRRGNLTPKDSGVDTREKLLGERPMCPYRKPTQVGEASSLRCTSETWSRNSA